MTQEKVSPLRERMMEDMRIRGMQETSQKAHIRAPKDFTTFLGRSPDTAEPDDLRAYQLHMADTNVTPSTFNARIVALRFFFSMTCDRDEMKKYMQFRTKTPNAQIVIEVLDIGTVSRGAHRYRVASLAEVSSRAPDDRARATAGLLVYAYLGFSMPVIASGVLADRLGLLSAMIVFAVAQSIATALIVVIWRKIESSSRLVPKAS
ncbi:hypothetical protein GCM10007927_04560 [Sulfitobacter pacificus]|uniref:Core-binding (CB) domain-containing protein n=2 Tax=Sulfitobacter pacificus TaxID=1499314 RepID=A0ABQ5VDR5_9RHOB|nr:hypothetical protein GCM10007927_04560 [Sulfitobacter pacificus]